MSATSSRSRVRVIVAFAARRESLSAKVIYMRVEFFGVPRSRVGMRETIVLNDLAFATLRDVLAAVGAQHPNFSTACLEGEHLRPGFLANIDGERFERNLDAVITDQQTLLILSADAGG